MKGWREMFLKFLPSLEGKGLSLVTGIKDNGLSWFSEYWMYSGR